MRPLSIPPLADAGHWATQIQQHRDPMSWPEEILKAPAEYRDWIEDYLRGIAARMRVLKRMGKS